MFPTDLCSSYGSLYVYHIKFNTVLHALMCKPFLAENGTSLDTCIHLEKRSCQLFYYCVHMALPNDTAIQARCLRSYVSFYVRCSVPGPGPGAGSYSMVPTIARPAGRVLQTFCCCLFGCACTRNFLLWNCFLYELFRIFRLLAWLTSFRRCCGLLSRNITL